MKIYSLDHIFNPTNRSNGSRPPRFFQDHDNFARTDGYSASGQGGPNTDYWSNYNTSGPRASWNEPGTGANFTFYVRYDTSCARLHADLSSRCADKHTDESPCVLDETP